MLNILNNKSNSVLEKFLDCYSETSKLQYKSSVNRFCEFYSIQDLSEIIYKQYIDYEDKGLYLLWFIKYLYGYDYLKNEVGFPNKWFKDEIIEHFENRRSKLKNKENSIEEKKEIRLTVNKIYEIEEFFKRLSNESSDIVYAFSWYMLFNTDCGIDEFKKIKLSTFDGEHLINKHDKKYLIPAKFHYFINQRNATQNKLRMTTLDVYIRELGEMFEIDNLLPSEIREAKRNNTLVCPNCVEKFPSREGYWFLYQGRLVCCDCAEVLKKKT